MLGSLHIKDKIYQMLGKLIRDSGWEWVFTKAGVLTSGKVSSALNDGHIKRSRYTHQVSVAAFTIMKRKAYNQYSTEAWAKGQGLVKTFEKWSADCIEKYPMFFFWQLVIDFQLLLMRFIRSLREGDFELQVQVCDELGDWAFAFDRPNY